MADDHSTNSSLRAKLIEHLLVGDLMRALWRSGRRDIEVLRAEVDAAGYDVAIECRGIFRHIQLKTSYLGGKTSRTNIHLDLAAKPGGCVIWTIFDPQTLALGPFLFLGGAPGEPMPDLGARVARHTRGAVKGERPRLRVVNKGAFTRLDTIEDLAEALFGGAE